MDIAFGDAIRAARQSLGVRQEDLADRVGMKRSQLSRLENGNPKNPGMPTRQRLAEGLGISVDEVMRIGRDYIDSSPMVVQLQPDQVQHWVDTMRRDGRGAPSIQHALRVVRQAFRHARLLSVVTDDPTRGVKAPRPPAKERVTWTTEEVARVSAALHDAPMWAAVYRLALTTGIRPGEMLALQWSDINLTAGELTVRRTMTKAIGGGQRVGERTKGGKPRTIMLPAATVASLTAWRKVQVAERLASSVWDPRDFVLTNRRGTYLTLTQWHRYHDELIARAGVPDIRLHDMRHTYATLAFERNIHPKIVQEVLGHRSIKITMDTYSHVSRDLQAAAAEALDAHLFPESESGKLAQMTHT